MAMAIMAQGGTKSERRTEKDGGTEAGNSILDRSGSLREPSLSSILPSPMQNRTMFVGENVCNSKTVA